MSAASRGPGGAPVSQPALLPLSTLTLQQAWCILQPAMRSLDALGAALALCEGRVGGAILDALCEALHRSADESTA